MNIKYHEEAALDVVAVETDNSKKTVFLIGDSIRMGYCEITKRILSDVAEVIFPDDNCRYTQYTFVGLSQWKNLFYSPEEVDVVYWNNGHWDIAHWDGEESLNSIEEYTKMLVRIKRRISTIFPNAKIVFFTTMPMNPNGMDSVNPRTTAEIKAYNKAAVNALKNEIYIDDVFSEYENLTEDYFSDYCHLTEAGNEMLGKHVAEYIKNLF